MEQKKERRGLREIIFGKKKEKPSQQAATFTGYTPQFTAFGNDVNVSDLVIESIRLKADFCSKLDPRYIKTENGTQKVITDTRLAGGVAGLLRTPNAYMTMADFLYKACFLRYSH